MDSAARIPHAFSRRFLWSGYLIGFALGGFFDGILLHQILQWHHLLSAVQAEAVRDLRVQVLADGLFHALMYAVAAAGLWMLYRSRAEFTGVRADRNLLADVLIGFGVWHVIDAVVSHWLLGLHRIRMDVPEPLVWDVLWLAVFGLVPFAAGLALKKRYPRDAPIADRRAGRHGLALGITALALLSATWAGLPPKDADNAQSVTVVLRADVSPGEFLASLDAIDARVLWSDRAGGVWVVRTTEASSFGFYRRGAVFVSGSVLPAACSAWLRV